MLRALHDEMAPLTMPRFVFMTPEWVSSARHILTERAARYSLELRDVSYTFAEEFTNTPAYAFPDASHGGFWVRCERGLITVGAGPLPAALAPADGQTKGPYALVVPVGRTVDAAMTEQEKEQRTAYSKQAFRPNAAGEPPVTQGSPSGKGRMPTALMRVFAPLHDELSKRTSGRTAGGLRPGVRGFRAPAIRPAERLRPILAAFRRVRHLRQPAQTSLTACGHRRGHLRCPADGR